MTGHSDLLAMIIIFAYLLTAYIVGCNFARVELRPPEVAGKYGNNTRFLEFYDSTSKILERLEEDDFKDLLHENFLLSLSDRESKLSAKNHVAHELDFISPLDNEGKECYLIKLETDTGLDITKRLTELLGKFGANTLKHFSIGREATGYKICFPDRQIPLKLLKGIKWIQHMERDAVIRVQASQQSAPWGLATLSYSYTSTIPKLRGSYLFSSTGKGVTIYLVDSGVAFRHPEFGGRASIGYDMLSNGVQSGDCSGHGTEVASVIVGTNIGVAKEASLVAVSVLDCAGEGTNSDLVFAIDWIIKNRKGPCVINMSVGGERSRIVDAAVRAAVDQGIPVVVAAGNSNTDACTQSPSGESSAIVVGAISRSMKRADFSNYGTCVDIFAPGERIVVANPRGLSASEKSIAYSLSSGTSLATPFVTGIVALLLEKEPNLGPEEIKSRLKALALNGKISGSLFGAPNLLAQAPKPSGEDEANTEVDMLPPGDWPDDSGMSALAITLMTVGIVLGVVLLITIVLLYLRRRRIA